MGEPDGKESNYDEWARCIYEKALETAHHADTLTYEVAAIIWSANTLLLGFILEVPLTPARQSLVVWTALIALILTGFVPFIVWLVKKGQRIAFDTLQVIEANLPGDLQLHTKIHGIYPKRYAQYAIWFLTIIFAVLWLGIAHRAACISWFSN